MKIFKDGRHCISGISCSRKCRDDRAEEPPPLDQPQAAGSLTLAGYTTPPWDEPVTAISRIEAAANESELDEPSISDH